MTTTKPEALLTTPNENALCERCDLTGARFEPEHFAHCPECGSTDLVDTRSPFEVLYEAERNAAEPGIDPERRLGRLDVVDRVRPFTEGLDPEHCSDCYRFAPLEAR